MQYLISTVMIFLIISCNSQQKANHSDSDHFSAVAREQELQITAKFISSQEMAKKFRIEAVIQNETGITSFSIGDTVSLYPNFLRKEGELNNTNSTENEHMASIKTLIPGKIFKAKVKINGQGNDRYGLIMDWEN